MFSLVCYGFQLLFAIFFFFLNWYINVFVSVVKKRLRALGMLVTQQIILFEKCIEINFITCG